MIRDTVMNHNDYDPLTDVLIGEAVLSLLKSKGPISKQALIGKLQAMQAGEQDKKRRNAIGRIIDEINKTVGTSGAKHNWDKPNSLLGSPQQPGTNKIH